jgi:hypothetical protein
MRGVMDDAVVLFDTYTCMVYIIVLVCSLSSQDELNFSMNLYK